MKNYRHVTQQYAFSGLSVPVIVAPMYTVSGPELVNACCAAGIVGTFPLANATSIEQLKSWLETITNTQTSNKKWGASIIAHKSNDRYREEVELLMTFTPPLVITALGCPTELFDKVHSYGGMVFCDVATVKHAKHAASFGIDGLILICNGAGGHTGTLSAFSFLREVREFWDGYIVVAGGICDGGSVAACQIMDADLCYMGTRFICAAESMASEQYQQFIFTSSADNIKNTSAFTGIETAVIDTSVNANGLSLDQLPARRPIEPYGEIHGVKPWREIFSAGHGVGSVKATETVKQIVGRLKREYNSALVQRPREISSQSTNLEGINNVR